MKLYLPRPFKFNLRFRTFILLVSFVFFAIPHSFAQKNAKSAQAYAKKGDYQSAYEILLKLYSSQKEELKNARQLIDFYRNKLRQMESDPRADVSYERGEAAKRLWREAWELQRTAVFTKFGSEKEDMLEDALLKYREITTKYPGTKEAEEAQYRIGRIHAKFLKNRLKAKEAFEKYLALYPQGDFAEEIRKELQDKY